MRKKCFLLALALALVAAGVVRSGIVIGSRCQWLTPDDTFWWWLYDCEKESSGGGSSGAG